MSPVSASEQREYKTERQLRRQVALDRETREANPTGWAAVDRTRKQSLSDFVKFCGHLRVENGKPLKIEPFQKRILRDYFRGATETVVVIPKKCGKSTLLGALSLYHLARTRDAECVIGAASRDQATILFNQAAGLARRSDLRDEFDVLPGYREIRLVGDKMGGRIRVLAADAATADGVIPTLALVDELHRHPSGELYGVFRDGLGPRDGKMITISTAGAAMDSPLGLLRIKAHELKGFTRKDCYNHSATEDGSFVWHEWCLAEDDDPTDMRVVKHANPASWQTVKALQRRHDSPSTTPWQWLRFACGVWTQGDEPWLDPAKWDALEADIVIDDGPVYVCVDWGPRSSDPVLVIAELVDDQVWVAAEFIKTDALRDVEDRIRDVHDHHGIEVVAYTNRVFQRSAEELESEGLTVVFEPLTPLRMKDASAGLLEAIEEGRLRHDGDPQLRSHVVAGRVREDERDWRLVKDANSVGLIALAVAVQMTKLAPPAQFAVAFT